MNEQKMIDHLFRHHYGKMVSVLTRIFGLKHLELIEDAIQDTFINALKAWGKQAPDNPEAWLTTSAKNRVLDLFRRLSAENNRKIKITEGIETIAIHELFLSHEVEDSVLRMIFTACNPVLNPKDQIAFALKTIAGFSGKEIASALLLKEETVKKRLVRARKMILEKEVAFEIPTGHHLAPRLARVQEVIYLIFNEGFHSNRKDILIRQDLCGEAMRLTKILLQNSFTATSTSQALFALFCFQAARLPAKVDVQKEIVSLRNQDRSQWFQPLITLGHQTMNHAVETLHFSQYHYEAAIAAEHTQATSYAATNWDKILMWYEQLNQLEYSPFNFLNMAVVQLQRKKYTEVKDLLAVIQPQQLEQRAYLYYGTYAEYAYQTGDQADALRYIDQAITLVENQAELQYLMQRKHQYQV